MDILVKGDSSVQICTEGKGVPGTENAYESEVFHNCVCGSTSS